MDLYYVYLSTGTVGGAENRAQFNCLTYNISFSITIRTCSVTFNLSFFLTKVTIANPKSDRLILPHKQIAFVLTQKRMRVPKMKGESQDEIL